MLRCLSGSRYRNTGQRHWFSASWGVARSPDCEHRQNTDSFVFTCRAAMLSRKSLSKDLISWFGFETQQQMITVFQVLDKATGGSYRNAASLSGLKRSTSCKVDGFTSVVPSVTSLQLQFFSKVDYMTGYLRWYLRTTQSLHEWDQTVFLAVFYCSLWSA